MSLLKIYWRAMEYLAAEKAATITMCIASVLVALVMLAEPILFGQVIQAISDKGDIVTQLAMWAALGGFNIIAAVFVARGADRLAHRRRLGVMIDFMSASSPCLCHGIRSAARRMLCTR